MAATLAPLSEYGWHVLADRQWPGSGKANLDFILVGPGGLVILDAKDWRAVEVRDDTLYSSGESRTGAVAKLLEVTDAIHRRVATLNIARAACLTALAFTGKRDFVHHLSGVNILGEGDLPEWLVGLPRRMPEPAVEKVLELMTDLCPEIKPGSDRRPPRGPQPRGNQTSDQPALIDIERMATSALHAALSGPVETWMTFLHPEQNALVTTEWSGPARIRGAAGTGKTVVALHRAAYLAERSAHPVLFTSFVKTLPLVLEGLCRQFAPSAASNIQFVGLHRLAMSICNDAGIELRVDAKASNAAFGQAWRNIGARGPLSHLDERPQYWKEEIDHVIKGRGIYTYEEYVGLSRVGRKTAMQPVHREAVWDLFVDYQERMNSTPCHDFNDLVQLATEALVEGMCSRQYSCVIVDEVQDLNLLSFKLLSLVAGDGPNRLLIVGDGQQAVYPGGFTLSEAGISVRGRSSILRKNYRNTVEIINAAQDRIAGDEFRDLEGDLHAGMRDVDAWRHGPAPCFVRARSRRDLYHALHSQLVRSLDHGISPGDLAILTHTLAELEHVESLLRASGIPLVRLEDYDGVTTERVKLGTFKRAKGLDFKYVLIPTLKSGDPDIWQNESIGAYEERAERYRRELFVGMTRASYGLWLGAVDQPAKF